MTTSDVAHPPARDSDGAVAFRIAEYGVVEARLQFLREDLVRIETVAPLAVAAIYSWAFSRDSLGDVGGNTLFVIPVLISIVAFLRHQARYNAVGRIEEYLRRIEAEALVGGGYETWLTSRKTKRRWHQPPLKLSRVLLWTFMLGGTSVVACAMMLRTDGAPRAGTRIVIERSR